MTAAAALREPASPRILVTVGTDHHQFDRLIEWVNDWLARHPEHTPACFIQSGAASAVPACPAGTFLDAGQLAELLDAADVMVCHGGPGSIADAWQRGQVPIVVPRLRRLGEVVDDHQVDFCRKLAGLGRVRLAEDPAQLAELLSEAARDYAGFRLAGPEADIGAAIARFGDLIDELVSRPRGRLPHTRWARRIRRQPVTGTGVMAGAGEDAPGFVPAASANWHASGPSARIGLAGTANEEQG